MPSGTTRKPILSIIAEALPVLERALIPFVRQFANTGREWFDVQPLADLQSWLSGHLESELFQSVMRRRDGADGTARLLP